MSAEKRGRRTFTPTEDDAIWQYVNVENTKDSVTGRTLWRLLAARTPGRSAESLRGRYTRTLQPSMARQLSGRVPPVVWQGLRVVNLAASALEPLSKRPRRVKREEEEKEKEDSGAEALAAMAADEEEKEEKEELGDAGLSRGAVRRWLRNLPPLSEDPLVACLAAGEGRATVWDGEAAAEVETGPGARLAEGRVYRVGRSWSDRRAGERVVRLLEAAELPGAAVDVEGIHRRLQGRQERQQREKEEQKREEEEVEEEEDDEEEAPEVSAARAVAAELAACAGSSVRLALHALYVCSGVPADAFEYLSGAPGERVRPWGPAEDAALRDTGGSPLLLKLDPRLAARSSTEVDQRRAFLGIPQ